MKQENDFFELESKAFYNQMAQRRSIRDFSNKTVTEEILVNCIRTAGTAPSGANKQPWYFALITSKNTKIKIREAAEQVEKEFYSWKAPQSWLEDLKKFNTNHEKAYLSEAPALIAVFSRIQFRAPDGEMNRTYYPIESTGIAVGLLITALHKAGLATLTHTPRPLNFLNEVLGLDKSYRPFMMVVTGYPKLPIQVPEIQRKELDQILGRY